MKSFKFIFILSFLLISKVLIAQDDTEFQFLGVLTLVEKYKTAPWTEKEMAVVDNHFQRLLKENEKGKVVFVGRTQYDNSHPDLMGLVVFYAKDLEDAVKYMNDDPSVKAKIMEAKVHPYAIAIGKQ